MSYFSSGKTPNRNLETQDGGAGRDPRDLLGELQNTSNTGQPDPACNEESEAQGH